MTDTPHLPRTVRGKRPAFHPTEGVDEVMSMVVVLAQEMAVLRERFDTAERVMAARGIDLATEIESFEADDDVLRAREQALQSFYDRLFYLQRQRRSELENKYSDEAFVETLDKVATGDI
ncbi:hypothetical protein B2G71_17690 [Novosphingobium sp. PC22D]|uniref:hypothetical protein n=1 Tax=Novosphingobium sp. PC22D TaxID=1962403 RepID=UPI000BF09B4E|nr:hypothetical protein [Novosphingobium sp. PC22D]PEQ11385.1 hypothetical protein B2G71_17690 [Novosphingobium sp. PC22D]